MYHAVALSHELNKKPLAIEMGEDKVVLFRDSKNQAYALRDLCPHMHVSLSLGRVIDDHLQCAYHGLKFDGTGKCVHVPSGLGPLPSERVPQYKTHEQEGLLFVSLNPDAQTPRLESRRHSFWVKLQLSDWQNILNHLVPGVHFDLWNSPETWAPPCVFVRFFVESPWRLPLLNWQRLKLKAGGHV